MDRGQVTIEALLILGAFLMIIFGVSFHTVGDTEKYAKDVQLISDAKFAADRVAAFASGISSPYDERTAEVYMPGYTSPGTASDNKSVVWMASCISANGSVLNTTTVILRRAADGTITTQDVNTFSRNLGSGSWNTYVNTGGGYQAGAIIEDVGETYNLTFSLGNITSNTVPKYIISDCSFALAQGA